jgi:hypothetical protein
VPSRSIGGANSHGIAIGATVDAIGTSVADSIGARNEDVGIQVHAGRDARQTKLSNVATDGDHANGVEVAGADDRRQSLLPDRRK